MYPSHVRQPAVAGLFYPSNADQLKDQVLHFVRTAAPHPNHAILRALIVPHAGYTYSGSVAGAAYHRLQQSSKSIRRILLLGPSHYSCFDGLAVSTAHVFRSPLGDVTVDRSAVAQTLEFPQVHMIEHAHSHEHCLEVQLPFLQCVLDSFTIVPLLVGVATAASVAAVIQALWSKDSLVLLSTDLSHYLDDASARRIDATTCRKIEQLNSTQIGTHEACGAYALNGLLQAAQSQRLTVHTLDLGNSGDRTGNRQRVVGYGAWSLVAG